MLNTKISAVLVDPSLFTAPYDEELTVGLEQNMVEISWVCRSQREAEDYNFIRNRQVKGIFYPDITASAKNSNLYLKARKGLSHAASLFRLWRYVRTQKPQVVHFQWIVFPIMDYICIYAIKFMAPVVITIHDTLPFNGNPTSKLQVVGLKKTMALANHLIVHTAQAKDRASAEFLYKIPVTVIPHGILRRKVSKAMAIKSKEQRWTIVMFGKIQFYKGLDVLVEALVLLPEFVRNKINVIVAGEVLTNIDNIMFRIKNMGLDEVVQFRFGRQSDDEVAQLLADADCFVFPYRQIDASGVFYLVADLQKWIVASDIGIFKEMISKGQNGVLISPASPASLALALEDCIGRKPIIPFSVSSWDEIGARTRRVYESALDNITK